LTTIAEIKRFHLLTSRLANCRSSCSGAGDFGGRKDIAFILVIVEWIWMVASEQAVPGQSETIW